MTKEELIAKYEFENNCIFKRRPDLDAHGDFSLEGIKVFCNSQFIEQLKALTPTAVVQAKPEKFYCMEDYHFGKENACKEQCLSCDPRD